MVGVGWGRPYVELDADAELSEVLDEIAKNPNWKGGLSAVRQIAEVAEVADLVFKVRTGRQLLAWENQRPMALRPLRGGHLLGPEQRSQL